MAPAPDAPADEAVSSWAAVLSALGRAVGGSVIHLRGGDRGACEAADPARRTHLAAADQNVLVRSTARDVARLGSLRPSVPRVTWALTGMGTRVLVEGADRNRAARLKMGAESGICLTAVDDVEFVKVVAAERGTTTTGCTSAPTTMTVSKRDGTFAGTCWWTVAGRRVLTSTPSARNPTPCRGGAWWAR